MVAGSRDFMPKNQVIEEARRGPSAWYAKSNSDDGQAQGVEAGPAQDGGWARAEGQPYRNLGFAAGHPIAEQSVDADRGQQHGEAGEQRQQQRAEAAARQAGAERQIGRASC